MNHTYLDIGESVVIVIHMEVTLDNDNQFANFT